MRIRHTCAAMVALGIVLSGCTDSGVVQPVVQLRTPSAIQGAQYALVGTVGLVAQIKTTLPSALCWDVGGSSHVTLGRCIDNVSYQLVAAQSDGTLRLNGSCLVAWGGLGADGDPLAQYGAGCGTPASKWTFTAASEIRGINNKCLQPSNSGNYGEEVVIMPCTGAANQKWSNAAGTVALPAPVAVNSVSVTLSTSSVTVGGSVQAAATVRDASNNALTDRTVVWTTADGGIATISSVGAILPVAPGTTTVTATVEGKVGTATLQVTVAGGGSSGSSSLAPAVVGQIKTQLPSALCWDAGSSSRVTLRTCQTNAGYQIAGLQANSTMLLAGNCLIAWGETGADGDPLTAYGSGCASPAAKWTFTAANEIRGINNKCLQPQGTGTVGDQIVLMPCTGNVNQKWSNSTGVTTTPTPTPVAVSSVAVTLSSSSLAVGAAGGVASAVVRDASNNALTGRTLSWSSSNAAVASISSTGAITALTAGTTTFTATVEGKTGTADFQVVAAGGGSTGTSALLPTVVGQIKTRLTSALCWDAGSSSRVTLRTCDKTAGYQVVALQSNATLLLGGSCLIAWGETGADGDPLTAYGPGCASPAAKWTFTSADEIRGINNKCLQTQGAGNAGEMILLMPCTGASNQKWTNVGSTPVLPTPVADVSVSLSATNINVGMQSQAAATVRDASSNVLTGRTIVWSTSNSSVASISPTGAISGVGVGSATLTATVESKIGAVVIQVAPAGTTTPAGTHSGFYVSSSPSGNGDGSSQNPWSLATALAQPSIVHAGDTIWLRGGTYRGTFTSNLTGTSGRPIVLRAYPGERASIDGTLNVTGSYGAYWGFEFFNSDVPAYVGGIEVLAPGNKFINLVVHDAAANGFGIFDGAPDTELYGNIVYNNGRGGSQPGRWAHGIYFHNLTGSKRLVDNIVFDSYAFNVHGYTTDGGLNNLYLEGNVSFNAGSWAPYDGAEFLIGGQQPVRNLTFKNNYSYHGDARDGRNEFGYDNTARSPIGSTITDNVLMGVTRVRYFDGITFSGNTLFGSHHETVEVNFTGGQSLGSSFLWNNNTYYKGNTDVALYRQLSAPVTAWNLVDWQNLFGLDGSSSSQDGAPSGAKVFVRANQYEAGRGHIVIYNFDKRSSVPADISSILRPGDRFEVRNVQNYYGSPVLSGTYGGGSISLPMAAVTAAVPFGAVSAAAPSTGMNFHTFVVIRLQ